MGGGEITDGRVTSLQIGDVDDYGLGCAILGCGGGGRTGHFVAALRTAMAAGPVRVATLDSEAVRSVAVVGLIGSTTVLEEKMPSGDELPAAVDALLRWTGGTIDAVAPSQIGGVIGPAAALTSARLGVPLLDLDCVGRAAPRIDQLSVFADERIRVAAAAVTSSGLRIVVDAPEPHDLETVWREAVSHTGGWAGFAIGPFPVDVLRATAVPGSVSRAMRIGRAAAESTTAEDLAARTGGSVIALGRVLDVERTGDVLSFVHTTFSVADARTGALARIEASNEYLHCLVDGIAVASTPSIITVVDARSLQPIATDEVRQGDEIAALTLPASPWWWSTPKRTAHTAPRAYGIDADVVPERRS
jgi:DUF917 family protein